jgi:hypothetical protein
MNVKNEQKQPKTLKIGYFIFWHIMYFYVPYTKRQLE